MRIIWVACAIFFCAPALAGDESGNREKEATLENSVPEGITQTPHDKFITLAVENDAFGRGTDQNYTSGVRLTYFDLNAEFPEIAREIADLVPTFDINRTSSVYYSLGQNLFTPDDITLKEPEPDDRPYAAFLYGSIGMATLTDNHIDEIEATVGVVGPWALGEVTQETVHDLVEADDPNGWDNQLENEPALMLSWQRRFPQIKSFEVLDLNIAATPYGGLTIGNVYAYANGGVSFRLSPGEARWSDLPLRVRPALPGTGFYEIPEDGWDWYLFGGLEGRAVARNIFLDGNTFESSPSVDKFPLVGDANAGVAFTLGRARVSYTLVYRSKEFEGQDSGDLFGALSAAYRF